MFVVCLSLFTTSFLFLDVTHSCEFITKWKPQNVGNNLVSITGVHEYVKARLSLQSNCIGTLVHPDTNVVFVLGKGDDDLSLKLKYILAQDRTKKLQACRELRKWIPKQCPTMIVSTTMLSENDKTVWNSSCID